MKILEKQSQKNLGNMVANEHLGKCVKVCLTNIWVAGVKTTWKLIQVSMVLQFLVYLSEIEH